MLIKLIIFLEHIPLTQPPNKLLSNLLANPSLRDYIILGKGLRPNLARKAIWELRVHLISLEGKN